MIESIEDFIKEFNGIKEKGWIKTHRSGPTGIGKTLEDLLGIPENNLSEPDFADYELKAGRIGTNSMLTLFTLAPDPKKSNEYLRQKYGYLSDQYKIKDKVLHSTLCTSKWTAIANTGHSLRIKPDKGSLYIDSEMGTENVFWTRDKLKKSFDKKYHENLVYARAYYRGSKANEEFKYAEAYKIDKLNFDDVYELIERGTIMVDLRIGMYPDGKIHDHGTGFRIKEVDHNLLFKNKERIA